MHDAARFNNVFALQMLLDKGCIDPSRQNVVRKMCCDMTVHVIKIVGYDIEKTFYFQSGNTPLHVGAFCGSLESIVLLLNNGSDPNLANEKGELPLHRAVTKGHTDVTKLLIAVTDINAVTKVGALTRAVLNTTLKFQLTTN